jgi:membrane-bound inhibitor of C-type lysozyme
MYGGISKYLKLVSLALGAVAVVFILAVITIGVVVGPQPASPPVVPTPGAQIIGGTKDAHGCLPGAGYSWCDAKEKCLRVWEESCTSAAPKVASFTCADDKSLVATFYPTDDKSVDLVLSDGQKLTVPHAMSADGARYAKPDESFVFWNKGDTAFITESGTTTFADCQTKN